MFSINILSGIKKLKGRARVDKVIRMIYYRYKFVYYKCSEKEE